MLSTWKDIAVFLDATSDGERIGRHAAALARRHKAHLIGMYGVSRDAPPYSEGFARGGQALREIMARRREADEQKALTAARRFADLCREYDVSSEFRVVWREDVGDAAALRTLHCDLIVAGHPKPKDLPDGWSAERLLLNSGIPVLLVPFSWNGSLIGDTVLIAWNASREARRVVADAMPFLTSAARVSVMIVDGDRNSERFGEDPRADLLRHLTKHNIDAEMEHVQSQGAAIGEVISSQAIEKKADLLVIGAYSHPRMTEIVFGGVTRYLLANVSTPTLISR